MGYSARQRIVFWGRAWRLCRPAYRDNGISMELRLRARPQGPRLSSARLCELQVSLSRPSNYFLSQGTVLANIVISIRVCKDDLNSEDYRRLQGMWEVYLTRLTLVECFLL